MRQIQKTIAEFVIPAVAPTDPVSKAVSMMKNRSSDCALVIKDDKLVGVFTERDFLFRVLAEKRVPDSVLIEDVMTPEPETLRDSDSIAYAINRMVVRGFRNIPIVSDRDRPISVLSIRHVMEHMNELFSELEDDESAGEDEWTDLGGG